MGVFEKVGETISTAGKDVAAKAKYAGDINKIKRQISYEEEKISDFLYQLGKKYFDENSSNPDERYSHLCKEVEVCSARIERLKQQVCAIKGVKICKNCGAVINDNFLFCGVCGTKLPDPIDNFDPDEIKTPLKNNDSALFSQLK